MQAVLVLRRWSMQLTCIGFPVEGYSRNETIDVARIRSKMVNT